MDDLFDPLPDETLLPAEERMLYANFRRRFVAFKRADVPKRLVALNEVQLPDNSVLHVFDHLLDMNQAGITFDVANPLITNEQYLVYAHHQAKVASKDDPLFPVTDRYRFVPASVTSQAARFFASHRNIKRPPSLDAVLQRKNILLVINYNTLFKAYLTGRMLQWRRFDLVFRTILSNIAAQPGKYHHIEIPVSQNLFTKLQFERVFNQVTIATLRIHDPSYYALMHLIGLLANAPTSLLTKLTQSQLDSTSIILKCGDQAIIYNLGDLRAISNNPKFYLDVIRHINVLKLSYKGVEAEEFSDDDIDQAVEVDKTEEGDEPEAPMVDTTTSEEEPIQQDEQPPKEDTPPQEAEPEVPDVSKEQVPLDKHIKDSLNEKLDSPPVPLTDLQKEKAAKNADEQGSITLDGVPLAELLDPKNEAAISENELTFLKDSLPDQSMASSTVMDSDRIYINKQLNRDIAAVLSSFAANGMILTDLRTKDEVTPYNRIRTYHVVFTDLEGKRHGMTFKLPIVSPDGTFVVNGIENRMVKQIVNLPICKVSSYRVNLSSNFNKTLVERTMTKANRYDVYIAQYISTLKRAGAIEIEFGKTDNPKPLPYDYTVIGDKFTAIFHKSTRLTFDYTHRFNETVSGKLTETTIESLKKHEDSLNAVYIGRGVNNSWLFMSQSNTITELDKSGTVINKLRITDIFDRIANENDVQSPKPAIEWTELKIRDKNFPIAFVLGYRFGIRALLKMVNHPTRFIPAGSTTREKFSASEIRIRFADGTLVFNRYPLEKSLVLAGLNKFKLQNYTFDAFDGKDAYFTILQENKLSVNYLKGIDGFFDFFVDPVTRDILLKMGEPTTPRGLLLRATQMLTSTFAIEASSMQNHRMRGYERFPDIIYNEISRALESFNTQKSHKKTFSINPEAVFQRIVQDPTVQTVEEINPMHDLKSKTMVTYSGMGGRTAQSFVIDDRRFPEDGVGVLSEATPDSGKVAINAYTSANPRIGNIRGMFTAADKENLEPANMLSTTALLAPGSTQDDLIAKGPLM